MAQARFDDSAAAPEQSREELRDLSRVLQERIKELDCLYGISHIVENSGGSLEYILQETVDLLPLSWGYPEITAAQIVIQGRGVTTENFSATRWVQRAPIFVHGEHAGDVDVFYLEQRPQRDEGPFTVDERKLLDAVAERLGRIVERINTERLLKMGQHELRDRLTHLARVSTMGEMASNIAHEVNQPLTAIGTFAQACRRMMEAGPAHQLEVLNALNRITDETQRAAEIVRRLKDLVRRQETERAWCNLNSLIRDVEHLAAVDARLHDTKLRLVLTPSLPPVLVDRIQIQQVILNLIRNGIDAMQASEAVDREVVVRTLMRGRSEIELSVCDNGCGLSSDVGSRLFEPFFTTKPHGVGVGLSISQSIVTAHHGRIWYSQNASRGTTFFVTLPTVSEGSHETA
ncbi:MAG: hypothetical protein JSW51_12155 [Gemmatimonadota bacterium]|nr:MAG: hypothetical protein JSW51_12155 [Gemmatimonadota bacterium]